MPTRKIGSIILRRWAIQALQAIIHPLQLTWLFPILLGLALASSAGAADFITFIQVLVNGANLRGANSVAVSPDGRHVYASSAGDTVVAFSRDGITGRLSLIEVERDGVGGVDGLDGAVLVTVSPDGRHVYAMGVNDNAVTVFRRYSITGRLARVETQRDGVAGVDGVAGADSAVVSPDGRHVYVAGDFDNAVAVFRRDETTGKLSFVEVERDGVDGVDGLAGSESVAISPDGRNVYVTGDVEHALAVFRRDETTGALNFVETQRDGVGSVDGLAGAEFVTISPDGRHVYVAGFDENALVLFNRNETTGVLSFVEAQRDGVGGVDGLANAVSVAVSPDGQYVYVVGVADNALTVFQRNKETGILSFVEVERDDVGGVDGLAKVNSVTVSPDGQHIYAAGWADNAVAVFGQR